MKPTVTLRDPRFLVLVLAMTFAAIVACSTESGPVETKNPAKGVYVPLSWKKDRLVENHRLHVAREHVACSQCHEIGRNDIGAVTPARCATCHEKQSKFEHAKDLAAARFGQGSTVDCTTCHAFVAGEDMPSRADAGHAAPDAGATEASTPVPAPIDCTRCHSLRQGNTPAVEVHGSSECVKCHRPHEDVRGTIGPCPECHAAITTGHAKGAPSGNACIACHSHQHAPASEAVDGCATCHEKSEPKIPATALFEDGHRQCIGCHRPHEFTRASAAPCRSCHAEVRVLAQATVPSHARCQSCHTPHDVRAAGDAACAGCHTSVKPDHPSTAGHACTSCHDPHPASQNAKARTCSSCHQTAASDSAFHAGVDCEKCHAPHDFAKSLDDRIPCTGCHQKQVHLAQTLTGHTACQGCHRGLPHHPERLEVGCNACHAGRAASPRPGHGECRGCHEPHGGSLVAQCKTCHVAEQHTAKGGHQDCTACHEPHGNSPARGPCGRCHEKEAQTPHGKIGESCASCHRAHGPGGVAVPPPCTTCHQQRSLPGLHAKAPHGDCTDCHSSHGEKPSALRPMCLSCHTDKKAHFPDAPTCASCHLFGPTR